MMLLWLCPCPDRLRVDFTVAGLTGKDPSVGHDEAGHSAALAVGDGQVVDEVLNPRVADIAVGRLAEAPADVVLQKLAGPIGDVERRIGQDVVGLQVGVQVAQERVGGLGADVGFDCVDG
jgi:hypothetical protein